MCVSSNWSCRARIQAIVRARATAIGAGVPLNAVSVSPLRITLWCDRPHVDDLTRALHKAFVES